MIGTDWEAASESSQPHMSLGLSDPGPSPRRSLSACSEMFVKRDPRSGCPDCACSALSVAANNALRINDVIPCLHTCIPAVLSLANRGVFVGSGAAQCYKRDGTNTSSTPKKGSPSLLPGRVWHARHARKPFIYGLFSLRLHEKRGSLS